MKKIIVMAALLLMMSTAAFADTVTFSTAAGAKRLVVIRLAQPPELLPREMEL